MRTPLVGPVSIAAQLSEIFRGPFVTDIRLAASTTSVPPRESREIFVRHGGRIETSKALSEFL